MSKGRGREADNFTVSHYFVLNAHKKMHIPALLI